MYYEKHRSGPVIILAAADRKRAAICVIVVLTVLFALLNIRAAALIKPAVEAGAASMFTEAVSGAVNETMTAGEHYDPVTLSRGDDGMITAVETDMAAVNRLKADVSIASLNALKEGRCSAYVPVGSLTGIPLLAGKGPSVTIKLRPAGGVESELYSTLEEAGINQTRHSITCVVSAKVHAMLPGIDIPLELSTTVLIAESVVVGRVPDSYTNVIGDRSDTISRIFDYAEPGK